MPWVMLLLVFAMLSYTVIFDFFGIHTPLRLPGCWFDVARFILFFVLLYPPLRSAWNKCRAVRR
jgi:hypothetical protein